MVVRGERRVADDGGQRLLDLQEEVVALVVPLQEHDVVAGADAPDAHHLVGDVEHAVVLQQLLDVGGDRREVRLERVQHRGADASVRGGQDRRIVMEATPAFLGQAQAELLMGRAVRALALAFHELRVAGLQ